MVRIVSDAMFLQSIFTFGPMFTASTRTQFFNNQPFGYETIIPWNDAIETAYVGGRGTPMTTAFTGDALGISPLNIATGAISGRVEGMFTYTGQRGLSDLVSATSIWGFDLALRDIRAAALTSGSADDRALMRGALAGNDVFVLSRFGDIVNSFGGADTIFAGAGNDKAIAGGGADRIDGGSGADTIYGGAGHDRIFGGVGADEMFGGTGSDVFVFDDGHIGLGIGARDLVHDWNPHEDTLDFSRIDADTRVAGDQALWFRTSNDGGILNVSNCVVMYVSGDDVIFRFEVTGDAIPDFDLRMVGADRFYTFLFKDATAQDEDRMYDF